jgi:hypothetical protein
MRFRLPGMVRMQLMIRLQMQNVHVLPLCFFLCLFLFLFLFLFLCLFIFLFLCPFIFPFLSISLPTSSSVQFFLCDKQRDRGSRRGKPTNLKNKKINRHHSRKSTRTTPNSMAPRLFVCWQGDAKEGGTISARTRHGRCIFHDQHQP